MSQSLCHPPSRESAIRANAWLSFADSSWLVLTVEALVPEAYLGRELGHLQRLAADRAQHQAGVAFLLEQQIRGNRIDAHLDDVSARLQARHDRACRIEHGPREHFRSRRVLSRTDDQRLDVVQRRAG